MANSLLEACWKIEEAMALAAPFLSMLASFGIYRMSIWFAHAWT